MRRRLPACGWLRWHSDFAAAIVDRITPATPGRVYQAWRVDWPRERLIPVVGDSVACDRR